MKLADIPTIATQTLEEIASAYEARAKQYHAKQLVDECNQVAKLCRDEVAKRSKLEPHRYSGRMNPTVDTLAIEFSRILKTWLTPEQIAEVISLNATPEYTGDICASHDFCDANMAMAEAFEKLGLSPFNEDGFISDETMNLWNTAWSKAKSDSFRTLENL